MVFWAQYGNTNSQGVIGSGTDSCQKQTGQTDSLGMEDTRAETNGNTMSINFWGLENWWGNKAEFIDNVVVNPVAVTASGVSPRRTATHVTFRVLPGNHLPGTFRNQCT